MKKLKQWFKDLFALMDWWRSRQEWKLYKEDKTLGGEPILWMSDSKYDEPPQIIRVPILEIKSFSPDDMPTEAKFATFGMIFCNWERKFAFYREVKKK